MHGDVLKGTIYKMTIGGDARSQIMLMYLNAVN
jgi:hypothetical protein